MDTKYMYMYIKSLPIFRRFGILVFGSKFCCGSRFVHCYFSSEIAFNDDIFLFLLWCRIWTLWKLNHWRMNNINKILNNIQEQKRQPVTITIIISCVRSFMYRAEPGAVMTFKIGHCETTCWLYIIHNIIIFVRNWPLWPFYDIIKE